MTARVARAGTRPPAAGRYILLRRGHGITGRLVGWACQVPAKGSHTAPVCTARQTLTNAATLTLPAKLTGRVQVVVIHGRVPARRTRHTGV